MGWADHVIKALSEGREVSIRPRGNSMNGRVNDGQLVVVKPVALDTLSVNDVVLCKVGGRQYLHLVTAIDGDRFQISNNKGHVNGWVGRGCIYGKADV